MLYEITLYYLNYTGVDPKHQELGATGWGQRAGGNAGGNAPNFEGGDQPTGTASCGQQAEGNELGGTAGGNARNFEGG